MKRIGVLALQGDFAEHKRALERVGTDVIEVRLPHQLDNLDGLVIPGGESTSLRKLAESYNLMDPLRHFALERPTWGTCAGAILLAREIVDQAPHLAVMDIKVKRNAFGRQINSFVTNVDVEGGSYSSVFIRAPLIVSTGYGVKVLARLEDDGIVAAQQGHMLATVFHPELTDDLRFHHRFVDMV